MTGPLSYIGGKNRLAATIIKLLPEHTTYVEPFAGGAQVLFHKPRSKVEVLNDLDDEIVNFFRICQNHHDEFLRCIKFHLMSRRWYGLLLETSPEALTDVQRAVRFFYIQKNSFGGLVIKPNYHVGVQHPPNYNPERLPIIISKTHERLMRVQLECLPYEQVLEKFDRPTSLFYIDPPYYDRALYKSNLSRQEFVVLRDRLKRLKGKFLLSLNDQPEVRSLFSDFEQQPIELAYTAQRNRQKRYPELLISNYPLTAQEPAEG